MLMPDSEGFEVLRIVRAEAPDTGFIMMSGASGGFLDLLKRAPHLGADAVLEKPFDPSDLLDLIGGIRDRKKAEGDAVAGPDPKDRLTRGVANHE